MLVNKMSEVTSNTGNDFIVLYDETVFFIYDFDRVEFFLLIELDPETLENIQMRRIFDFDESSQFRRTFFKHPTDPVLFFMRVNYIAGSDLVYVANYEHNFINVFATRNLFFGGMILYENNIHLLTEIFARDIRYTITPVDSFNANSHVYISSIQTKMENFTRNIKEIQFRATVQTVKFPTPEIEIGDTHSFEVEKSPTEDMPPIIFDLSPAFLSQANGNPIPLNTNFSYTNFPEKVDIKFETVEYPNFYFHEEMRLELNDSGSPVGLYDLPIHDYEYLHHFLITFELEEDGVYQKPIHLSTYQ